MLVTNVETSPSSTSKAKCEKEKIVEPIIIVEASTSSSSTKTKSDKEKYLEPKVESSTTRADSDWCSSV